MAINSYEFLLTQKVASGEVSFTMDDMKGKTAAQRKALYRLGAYKNTAMSSYLIGLFGIRNLKMAIDKKIPMDVRHLWFVSFGDSLGNYEHIVSDIEFLSGYASAENLKKWSKYNRGRDLFIKGLGSFSINDAYEKFKAASPYESIVSPAKLICFGYTGVYNASLINLLDENKLNVFSWFIRSKFPIERADELVDLDVLGMWHDKLNLKQTLKRADDMTDRNLKLTYMDTKSFDYPEVIKDFCDLTEYTYPKNGIDLKRQAKHFSNCSGNYVESIKKNECYIIYSETEMISLEPKHFYTQQHYGKRNELIPKDKKTLFSTGLAYFIKYGRLRPEMNMAKLDYRVMYDTTPNGFHKNTVGVCKEMFDNLKKIATEDKEHAGNPICSSGFNKFVIFSHDLLELGYNHRKLVS